MITSDFNYLTARALRTLRTGSTRTQHAGKSNMSKIRRYVVASKSVLCRGEGKGHLSQSESKGKELQELRKLRGAILSPLSLSQIETLFYHQITSLIL